MNDHDHCLADVHIDDRMQPSGRPSGHVHPLVRALPRPTAHPAPEAWQSERFARLQQRLPTAAAATGRGANQRSVVVLPSRSLERWHEPAAETRSYEERLLSFIFDLHDPTLELTYVTSLPVPRRTVEYYISLLPRQLRGSARARLRLVSLNDGRQRPLSEKLLQRPRVLEQIRRNLAGANASYLMPYNSTALEREIALGLDIPLFGTDPGHAWLGTKTGSRALFARAGIPHPLGSQQVRTIADVVEAIRRLRSAKADLGALILKLDHAVSGEGNAIVDLAGLPAPGTAQERSSIQQRVLRLVTGVDGISPETYLRKFAAQGGVVEERITGRELRSPSVQLEIAPGGTITLLSTHDQILHGRSEQSFAGCRFPADRSYAPLISALAQRVAEHLADTGVIGRFGIDFLVVRGTDGRWQPFALEVNLRMGGTTHPYQTLVRLTGGSYDARTASFTTRRGHPRHYVATDHLTIAQLPMLGQAGLLARATAGDLRFDHHRGRGVVFHMLSSVESLATVGVTAIGDTPQSAEHLYAHVSTELARAGDSRGVRARRLPVRVALGTKT